MRPERGALIFLLVVVGLLLPAIIQMARPFFTSFILGLFIAIVVNPVKEWLQVRLLRPGLAAALTTFGTMAMLAGCLTIAGMTISREISSAYESLNRRSLEEGGWPALIAATVDRIADAVATHLPVNKEAIREEIIDRTKVAGTYLLRHLDVALGGIATVVITIFLVTLFVYFLLRYGREWTGHFSDLVPLPQTAINRLAQAAQDSIVANVNGVFAVAVTQGLLLIAAFWFVGLRSPVLWGTIGGLASVIPLVGAPLIWVPVVIGYVATGAYGKALILGLWGALAVGSIDNILRPIVVGARERQHPMLIALAAIGGTYAFGALGILLGPLIISLLAALLKEIQHSRAGGAVSDV